MVKINWRGNEILGGSKYLISLSLSLILSAFFSLSKHLSLSSKTVQNWWVRSSSPSFSSSGVLAGVLRSSRL
jgi:hypothetical protein